MEDNQNNNTTEEPKGINISLFISIAIIMFMISIGSYIFKFHSQSISNSSGDWGTFGDFIGGTLNPIFAFLSFIALLYTINLQSKELALSTKELHETKKATRDSATALEEQSKSIKIQNFENTFFNMLDLHTKIVDTIKIEEHLLNYHSTKTTEKSKHTPQRYLTITKFNYLVKEYSSNNIIIGREAIENICKNIDSFIKDRHSDIIKNSSNLHIDSTVYKISNINQYREPTLIYDLSHECYSNTIGHYFGNIYQILKFISTSENINKRKYSDLFRAQFSAQELKLLFYHCAGSIGSERFKPYIEEFEFLEHLNIEKDNAFVKYILYKSIYKNSVFGINNMKKIESIKNTIRDNIIAQINKINEEDKYKHLDLYKYFSKEEIERFLQKLKEDTSSYTNQIGSKKLILSDFSENDNNKNYTFKEE